MRSKVYTLMLIVICSIFCKSSIAQDFLGISTGNYAGVTGLMLQPASIVDSRYKFDVNLFSTGINFSNNYLLVNRDALLKFNKDNYGDYNTFKEKYLTQASLGSNEKAYFNVTNRTQMPLSFMATTGKKSAIALNIQSRSMIQGRDIPQGLASLAYNGFTPGANATGVDASGFNILALNWIEVGFTYGRVLYSNEKNFLKVAFTGKYLGGVSSLYLGSNDLRMGINRDSTFNFNTSNTQYSHNKNADFNNIFDRNFSPDASSFGFDAGLVYEYRGNIDKFKYISRNDEKSYEKERRDVNKYMFKLGISLLDAGKFNFNKPASVSSFSGNINNWDIRNQRFSKIADFDTALAHRTTALPNDPKSYSVYLPTAMSIQLDIRFIRGFYLNFMSYNSVKLNSDNYHFNNYDYYTITPRWESRNFGIYIPYTFGNHQQLDAYKDNLLGATVRIGPLFIGSSNLGTMAFNKNLKAADVHVGLKIGFTYGKPNKASMFLDKITSKRMDYKENDTNYDAKINNRNDTINKNTQISKINQSKKTSQLIVDYKNGQIYSDGNQSGNIIIVNNNNYYYYGNNGRANKDSTISNSYIYDSSYKINDSLSRINHKYDSTQKKLNDSLNRKKARLDSLIINMQELRKGMDSISLQNNTDTIFKTTPKKTSSIKTKDSKNTAVQLNNTLNTTTQVKNDTTIKVSNTATTKNITEKDKITTNSNDPSKLNNQQQQYLPNQREGIVFYNANPQDVKNNNAYKQKQEDNFNRYLNESKELQREIRDLQMQVARQHTTNNRYPTNNNNNNMRPNYIPVYVPAATNKTNVIYIRDTIYIKDTTRLLDTVMLTKNEVRRDTITRIISARPDTIKSKIDYSNVPSEFVLFATGRSSIQTIYNERLNYISNILKKRPKLFGLITGHTDATGSQKINEALSLKRAETVKRYLQNKGVKETQLIVTTELNNDENNKAANAENRRTDIKISNKNN